MVFCTRCPTTISDQFQRLVHDRFPDLFEHFSEKFINADLYAAEWFLSCFSSTFPLLFVLEFFDQVMAVGIPAVFRMGLGLLEHEAEKLLAQDDEEELLYHLKVKVAQMPSLKLKRILRESASVAFDSEFLRELELEVQPGKSGRAERVHFSVHECGGSEYG